ASSTMNMRAAPSKGRKFASRSNSRMGLTRMICLYGRTMATSACSLQISLSLLSSALVKGGKEELSIRLHDEHSSQASTPERLRQLSAFASSRAKRFLPIPSSPVNRRKQGMRPPVIRRLSDSFTSSLPMRVENIEGWGFGLRSWSKIPDSKFQIPDSRFQIQNSRFKI